MENEKDHGASLLPGDPSASPASTEALPTNEPFVVEVEKEGCERCGHGAQWTVVGPGEIAISQSFDDKELAEEIAEYMNQGYRAGCGGE